jgi:membrane associated rhomboid family serine protease
VILPLGDDPNPRSAALGTYALLLANVAVYVLVTLPLSTTGVDPRDPLLHAYIDAVTPNLPAEVSPQRFIAQISAYDLFVFRYGFRPAHPSLTALFVSLFLHANLLHLFGNMLFLWIYGNNVEHRLGFGRYLACYIATGLAATSFHAVFDFDSNLPLVGASGAISGVLGLYFLWFPHNRVKLFVLFFPFIMDTVMVPARLVLGAYLLLDNVLPFLGSRGGGGVAYGAHIGGFLAGLAIAWFVRRREDWTTPREYEAEDRLAAGSASGMLRAAMLDSRFDDAARLYFSLPPNETRGVLQPTDLLSLAKWLDAAGHRQAALVAYRRLLRDYPRGPGRAEAHVGAGGILLEQGEDPAAYQHFLDALDLHPATEIAAAARRGLDEIAARNQRRRLN